MPKLLTHDSQMLIPTAPDLGETLIQFPHLFRIDSD